MPISSCSFRHMKTLETLDVRGPRAELLNVLWKIGALRHVMCDHDTFVIPTSNGSILTADLRNLQTIWWVSPLRTWDRKLPLLNLCKIGVSNFFGDWVTMTNLLETLHSLFSLGMKGRLVSHGDSLPGKSTPKSRENIYKNYGMKINPASTKANLIGGQWNIYEFVVYIFGVYNQRIHKTCTLLHITNDRCFSPPIKSEER